MLKKKDKIIILVCTILVLILLSATAVVVREQKNKDTQKALDFVISCGQKHGLTNVTASIEDGYIYITCSSFGCTYYSEMADVLKPIETKISTAIQKRSIPFDLPLKGIRYKCNGNEYYSEQDSIYKNGKKVYQKEAPRVPNTSIISSIPSSKSTKTKKKCPVCNGTGSVRYYTAGSALEAWLQGYEDFYVGTCTSCDGTGYYYE